MCIHIHSCCLLSFFLLSAAIYYFSTDSRSEDKTPTEDNHRKSYGIIVESKFLLKPKRYRRKKGDCVSMFSAVLLWLAVSHENIKSRQKVYFSLFLLLLLIKISVLCAATREKTNTIF